MTPDALDHLLREDFASFAARSFATVNPGTEYLPNWHISLLAEYLEACRRGEISRLIVNLPPRALKSLCVSVAWPAFLIGHRPSQRVVVASYARPLALRHSLDCRAVVQSAWYRELFPATRLLDGQIEKDRFVTDAHGFRFATSVGGSVTGQGGNVLIVDDPHKPDEVHSTVRRTSVHHWFEQTFASRLDDKREGVIVLVMQRLHPDDLAGHLLARGAWEHLSIPALADAPTVYARGGVRKEVAAGEPLHPAREDAALIERARLELGSQAFAAQYLQRPLPPEGALLRAEWFAARFDLAALGDWADAGARPHGTRVIQSWDTGVKTGAGHDPSACVTALVRGPEVRIVEVLAARLEYPDLCRRVRHHAERSGADAVLIEDAASGQALLQELRRESMAAAIGVRPVGAKGLRLQQVSPMIEAGRVRLPRSAPWLGAFEAELFAFPHVPHDDRVDAFSQLLGWLREQERREVRVREV